MAKKILYVSPRSNSSAQELIRMDLGIECDFATSADDAITKISSGEYNLTFIENLAVGYNTLPSHPPDPKFSGRFVYGIDVAKAAREKGLALLVLHSDLKGVEAKEIEKMGGVIMELLNLPSAYIPQIRKMLEAK
jgi:hypothetical protein